MAAGRRILLIGSDPDSTDARSTLFDLLGHSVLVASSGRQGVERANQDAPDVILIDFTLDDMDGCEVARRIRAGAAGVVPVIIANSGYHHRGPEALAAGCDAFVLKPAFEELIPLIEKTREEVREYVETACPAPTRPR